MWKIFVLIALICINGHLSKKYKDEEKPKWAKKDIRDFTDADMERLLDQWEEDDEPLEDDELPEHLRPSPKIDMSKLDPSNPEALLQSTKKGRTLMAFVNVCGQPSKDKTEEITKLWQTSLWNSHIQAERYLVGDNRAIFLFKDGAQAWAAKDFLIDQEGFESISIENQVYDGKHCKKEEKEEL